MNNLSLDCQVELFAISNIFNLYEEKICDDLEFDEKRINNYLDELFIKIERDEKMFIDYCKLKRSYEDKLNV